MELKAVNLKDGECLRKKQYMEQKPLNTGVWRERNVECKATWLVCFISLL